MSAWAIIRNYKKIKKLFQSLKFIIQYIKVNKKAPDESIWNEFLKILEELLRAKVIDIPGVEESEIADVIKDFSNQLGP